MTATSLLGATIGGTIALGALLGCEPPDSGAPSPAPPTVTITRTVTPPPPHCPEEDSCIADYDGTTDRWVIRPNPDR